MTAALAVRSVSAGLAAALLLAACATLPPKRPAPPAPPVDPAQLGLSGAAVAPAAAQWWHTLGDGQLDTLIERALSDNPGLAETGARLRGAQAQVELAHAGELPQLRFSGGEERLKVPPGFGPYLLGGHTVWLGNLGAHLSWDVDLWGRQSQLVAAARGRTQAATLDLDAARLLLAAAVTQTYISLYRSYALADVAAQAETQRGRILAITRQRVAAGLDTRLELREAEGSVPQAHLVLLQEQSSEELLRHQLAALSGRGAEAYASIGRPTLSLPLALEVPTALPINLLARRPDVIAARARIAAADSQLRATRAAFYPSVNLAALAGFASISLKNLLSADSFGYGAGPAVSLPLFDAGRLRAQYRGAEADLDAAAASYDDTVLSAVREVADLLTQMRALEGEIEQQRQWSDAAEEAYRLAEERYRAGLATYLSVLNAETEVLSARRQSVELLAAQASARVTLLLALGGSFQPPQSGSVRAALPAGAAPGTADSTTMRTGS